MNGEVDVGVEGLLGVLGELGLREGQHSSKAEIVDRIRVITLAERVLAATLDETVSVARSAGVTFREIGEARGVTASAVMQRWPTRPKESR